MRYKSGAEYRFFLCALVIVIGLKDSAEAQQISEFEKICQEIGFKPRTIPYGECVLELDRRKNGNSSTAMQRRVDAVKIEAIPTENLNFEQAQDNRVCQSYGFRPNTPQLAECRFKLQVLREENARNQQLYEQQVAEYESRVAALEKERQRERALRQIELGARLLSGQSPVEAARNLGSSSPIAPSRPQATSQTIVLPGGRIVNCSINGNIVNCF